MLKVRHVRIVFGHDKSIIIIPAVINIAELSTQMMTIKTVLLQIFDDTTTSKLSSYSQSLFERNLNRSYSLPTLRQ